MGHRAPQKGLVSASREYVSIPSGPPSVTSSLAAIHIKDPLHLLLHPSCRGQARLPREARFRKESPGTLRATLTAIRRRFRVDMTGSWEERHVLANVMRVTFFDTLETHGWFVHRANNSGLPAELLEGIDTELIVGRELGQEAVQENGACANFLLTKKGSRECLCFLRFCQALQSWINFDYRLTPDFPLQDQTWPHGTTSQPRRRATTTSL